MPKMKTNKSAAKRFKLAKNKIKRGAAFRSHILTKKDAKQIAGLKSPKYVHSANMDNTTLLLCMR
jgi:large subunit ribosomal protein L35